jgi:ADP-heptose:LPS heptosyltransferase
VLVAKLDGIGDFALALPALRGLADACPGIQIDVVVSSFNQGWKEVVPWIRTFYFIDFSSYRPHEARRSSKAGLAWRLLTLGFRLRLQRYSAAFDLRTRADDWHCKFMTWLSGAPLRFGGPGLGSWALTNVITPTAIHQSDILVERMRIWAPKLEKAASNLVTVSRIRAKSEVPHVVLHPGVAGPERRWIWTYWIELARALAQTPKAMTFQFLGGPEDQSRLAEMAAEAGLEPGQTRVSSTLREMLQILADADLLVGLNSSAVHLAYLVGTPAITVFSAANNPASWAALGNNTVLFTPIECSPCHLPQCKWETHRCMEAITPATVMFAIEEKLRALGFSLDMHAAPRQ